MVRCVANVIEVGRVIRISPMINFNFIWYRQMTRTNYITKCNEIISDQNWSRQKETKRCCRTQPAQNTHTLHTLFCHPSLLPFGHAAHIYVCISFVVPIKNGDPHHQKRMHLNCHITYDMCARGLIAIANMSSKQKKTKLIVVFATDNTHTQYMYEYMLLSIKWPTSPRTFVIDILRDCVWFI